MKALMKVLLKQKKKMNHKKTRVKTPEQIKKMHDELKQIQQEYYNLYKAINKNDLTKINKRLMESKDLKDLQYVKRAFKNFKNKHDI